MKRFLVLLMIVLSLVSFSACNKDCENPLLPPDETSEGATSTTKPTTTEFSNKKIIKIVEEDLTLDLPDNTECLYFEKSYYGEEFNNIWGYVAKFSLSEEEYNKLSKLPAFNTKSFKNDEYSYNRLKEEYENCFDYDFENIKFSISRFASARLTETIYVKTVEKKGWLAQKGNEYILFVDCTVSKSGEYQE